MKFVVVVAAFFASAILVLPTVSQAQERDISEKVQLAASGAVNELRA